MCMDRSVFSYFFMNLQVISHFLPKPVRGIRIVRSLAPRAFFYYTFSLSACRVINCVSIVRASFLKN